MSCMNLIEVEHFFTCLSYFLPSYASAKRMNTIVNIFDSFQQL